ncbi:DUF5916 domain-containing protein [Frateuria hangzhouensis]|uniref:DUF5916 domain-containing protein n=1 Tax=Frateuria hangzhouensis TaxID=2995589 RepID=UPI0022610431|nr:DUF5916 domain-containing protein [Frateuria sp. STR12]MCX7513595.1 DUF5916 domain-containing protein [Frateuria sp. STR12]
MRSSARHRAARALIAPLALLALPAMAVEVDGHIDPVEWQGARHITDFRKVQPLNGEPGSLPTEAWVLSTPEGLAIAFRCIQPPGVPRTHQRIRRDEQAQVDRVNLMVDFDGDGRTGYNFMVTLADDINDAVLTNETQFNTDWDGNWKHASSEDAQGWTAEMLIPWYIAPMRKAVGGERTIGLYLDRVIGSTGERDAWPVASFNKPRFVSDFMPVTMPAYSQSLFAITPYVLGMRDQVNGDNSFDGGADIFWKPNGQTQLTATINPDFGQVESDDLVVNFGAEETFFTDKRPFFTENQGIFDFGLLIDNSQLIYTRRVGGAADDGSGAGDVAGAIKLNGSVGATRYGVLAAEENGDAGRSFSAVRLLHDFGSQSLGMLATRVERPWLDRDADVLGIDHRWQPNDKLTVTSNVVGSAIDEQGRAVRGTGATTVVEYEMNERWTQEWLGMHFDDKLDLNDFGYLPRNSLNYLHYEVRRRFADLPASSSYASHVWHWRVIGMDNDHGLSLQRQFRVIRESQRRDGGEEDWQLNIDAAAHDDLLTRGHGALRTPSNAMLAWERSSPRKGDWAWGVEVDVMGSDRVGLDRIGYAAEFEPTFFLNDAFSVFAGVTYEFDPDWLVWQHDNLVGSFDSHQLMLDAGVNWNIGNRQELRVKLQALGLDARMLQAYRVNGDMRAVAVDDPVADFSVRNLGFQIRYRYELAPLSDLYVVYGRGGYALDSRFDRAGSQFGRAFDLRDSEQLLIKLAYRFEL